MRPPRRRRSRRPGPAPAPSRAAQDAFEAGLVPSFGVAARATGLSCRVKATVAGRVVVRGARYAFGGGDRASASINRAWSSARASAASAALRFTLENFCAPSRSDRCTDTPAVVWGARRRRPRRPSPRDCRSVGRSAGRGAPSPSAAARRPAGAAAAPCSARRAGGRSPSWNPGSLPKRY